MTQGTDEHGKTCVAKSGVAGWCGAHLSSYSARPAGIQGSAREEPIVSNRSGEGAEGSVPAAALSCRGRAREVRHGTRRCAARTWVALIRDRRSVERRGGGGGRSIGRRAVRWKLGRRGVAVAAGRRGDGLKSHVSASRVLLWRTRWRRWRRTEEESAGGAGEAERNTSRRRR